MEDNAKKVILLIDDDTSLLLTLSDFLKFEGYQVVTADSGEQGLKRLEKSTPDLIVLDMSMPGMGGVGFLKEISTSDGKPKHPVLVLTARANMAEFFANVDVDGFVAKPCDPNDLLMEISRIIFLRSGEEAAASPSAGPKKSTIMLGEDDAALRDRIAKALADAGYIVETQSTGPDLLERSVVTRPDLIVVKLVLSGMNGDAVANVLKTMPNTKAIPVILYDDSGADVPETKFVEPASAVKMLLRSSDGGEIVGAAQQVLGA